MFCCFFIVKQVSKELLDTVEIILNIDPQSMPYYMVVSLFNQCIFNQSTEIFFLWVFIYQTKYSFKRGGMVFVSVTVTLLFF